ncbi:expressed unknown protein [Seminavis robusta]|uniref:Nucleotide-diphospho-sugar transferase domain-containing protein n=1 Tax=Seminavis robusta TaxID=568900 RepID=A0A9N8HCU8_9STRA|nr:expressed unknown protein [Seminavis robusta]|eukprot:Sro396_g134230.1 n/a (450) ;mRNA; r:10671-12020
MLALVLACFQVCRVAFTSSNGVKLWDIASGLSVPFKTPNSSPGNVNVSIHTGATVSQNDSRQRQHPRIAILLSMVPSKMWSRRGIAHAKAQLDLYINKACYAKLWHYDLIINTTNSFQEYTNINSINTTRNPYRPWLQFGAWNRVEHMQALMDSGKYDWILYGDHDMIIQDMTRPIESMLQEVELYGKDKSASAFVPVDTPGRNEFRFSSFGLMLKTNQVGRSILKHWREFAMGLCPKGNYLPEPGEENNTKGITYSWRHSDQPGLWYSLIKTHQEYSSVHSSDSNSDNNKDAHANEMVRCNSDTGYFVHSAGDLGSHFSKYFQQAQVVRGTGGKDLAHVPDNQSILWSHFGQDEVEISARNNTITSQRIGNGPFAVNTLCCMRINKLQGLKPAFAMHTKYGSRNWPGDMPLQLQQCKSKLGCYANLTDEGVLTVGCRDILYFSEVLFA